jgi:hypothetical protein
MPYKSKAQMRFMHAKHPKIAKEWDARYAGIDAKNLPQHVKKAKNKKKKA